MHLIIKATGTGAGMLSHLLAKKSRWSGFMNACLLLWHWNLSRWIRGCKL
ncbi:hypothetical protein NST07_04950 [Paenibacillus sp. FSL L8-0340]